MGGGKSKPELFSSPPPSEDTNTIQTHEKNFQTRENKSEVLLEFFICLLLPYFTQFQSTTDYGGNYKYGIALLFKIPKIAKYGIAVIFKILCGNLD